MTKKHWTQELSPWQRVLTYALFTLGALVFAWGAITAAGYSIAFGEYDEPVYWQTMRDGGIDVCATEQFDWIEQTLEDGWGIEVKENCTEPDLVITIDEMGLYDGQRACGLASWGDPCYVTLNTWCQEQRDNFTVEDVPEIALLHEVGHCMGYSHIEDEESVMQPVTAFKPTVKDIKVIYDHYGLTHGLIPEPQSGVWTMARWSGPTTETERLDVPVAYHLGADGHWLRYIEGAPDGVNTLTRLQPDQPLIVIGR